MSREILKHIIDNFLPENFIDFFRIKNRSFKPHAEQSDEYNDNDFKDALSIGQIPFHQTENLIIYSFKATKNLSERSGKKLQYEKGKKILKDTQADAGIFIFYDTNNDLRFSLIYPEYAGTRRQWNNFRRYTYFVSKDQTNKTFLNQIGDGNFSSLETIKEAFSVEKVTKEFYSDIANWYFWAMDMDKVKFPDDEDKDRERCNAKNLIRLITRIIFVWFMKEKKLILPTLFDKPFLDQILNYKDKTGSTYYKAILQNLFFATLNTPMKKDNPQSRIFIEDAKKSGYVSDGYMQQGYYRYSRFIKDKDLFWQQFENIPFLNGGLFESLDKHINKDEIRIDCFSDNPKNEKRLKVPDELFFLENEINVDLSKYLEGGRNKKVRGLLSILKSYNFTIDENTPVDEEVALDPELLGKVFENLLASYNPQTATTARKATGSYYTPREIVEYMVNESLIEYLKTKLSDEGKECEKKLRSLLDYNTEINPFKDIPKVIEKIINAIENIRILDPACGSGAFPMGILHKLVLALHKLDPDNSNWKKLLLERVPPEIRKETEQSLENKPLDYIRKLGLIEHCIYGVDIQEIAIQISKLRFFISLLVEQQPDDSKPNRDIKSLPNLETKFVAANTLIGLDKLPEELLNSEITKISKELVKIREEIFYANSRWKKISLEEKEKYLRKQLAQVIQQNIQIINKEKIQSLKLESDKLSKELHRLNQQPEEIEDIETTNLFGEKEIQKINKTKERTNGIKRKLNALEKQVYEIENPKEDSIIKIAQKIADFDPYDQNKSSEWFDPEWMFGVKSPSQFAGEVSSKNPSPLAGEGKGEGGFDIVIGNPPYVRQEDLKPIKPILEKQGYEVYNSTSDIYTYFYEKGWQVLNDSGHLTFITSNKWMRAKYGEKLRKFFKEKTALRQIIDFGGHKVFESATVDTNILILQKDTAGCHSCESRNPVKILAIKSDFNHNIDLSEYFRQNSITMNQSDLDEKCFTFGDYAVMQLKKKIEQGGVPLKDWNVRIYRGIITGFNDAFIIDSKTKESLCKEDPKSIEALKPILRGRDIQRYSYNWAGLWLIKIESGWTNKHRGKKDPEAFLKDSYPAIYGQLKSMGKKKGKGKGLYRRDDQADYWWELRDCDYYGEFEKEKLIYRDVGDNLSFAYEQGRLYGNNTVYFLNTGNKYLLVVLNSLLLNFYYTKISSQLGDAASRAFTIFIEQLPIPKTPESAQQPLINLVDQILAAKKKDPNADTSALEKQIDEMVYKLYGLTPDEIEIVEGTQ